ncbi:YajQ family cyclic di-GMP-binding protein [Nitratifractor sp.]
MAKSKEHYFDISAKLDMMEMKNAIEQAKKEVATRFDFKGVVTEINLNEKAKTLSLSSSSESKIDALKDILLSKMIKRGLSPKSLDEVKREGISGGNIKVIYRIVDSIDKEEAKKIVKAIKDSKLKVTPAIQGEEIRVSGKKIDDLQAVIALVRKMEDLKAPLVFGNFK